MARPISCPRRGRNRNRPALIFNEPRRGRCRPEGASRAGHDELVDGRRLPAHHEASRPSSSSVPVTSPSSKHQTRDASEEGS